METINGEPLIELDFNELNEDSGISAISFVEDPATLTTWFKFSSEEKQFHFEKDVMKRIVTGPVMLADTPIRRYDENQRYWVKFSADTIFKMRNKYFKENKIHNINENHNRSKVVDGVYMVESFMIDEKTQSNLYPDIPVGTWMASFYVEDEKYWNEVIMNEKFNGFSLEGNFGKKKEKQKNKYTSMHVIEKLKQLFSNIEDNEVVLENQDPETKMFIDVKTEDGRILRVSDMTPGSSITEITEEGENAAEPGDYSVLDENGLIIAIVKVEEEGIIASIEPVEVETEPEVIEETPEVEMEGEVIEPKPTSVKTTETKETLTQFSDEFQNVILESFERLSNDIKEVKEMNAKLVNENNELKERFNKFSAEPSDEKTQTTPNFNSKEDKLKFFAKR
jgi:hypothetical protein